MTENFTVTRFSRYLAQMRCDTSRRFLQILKLLKFSEKQRKRRIMFETDFPRGRFMNKLSANEARMVVFEDPNISDLEEVFVAIREARKTENADSLVWCNLDYGRICALEELGYTVTQTKEFNDEYMNVEFSISWK